MRVDSLSLRQAAPGAEDLPLLPAEAPQTSFEDVVTAALHEASQVKQSAIVKADSLASGTLDDVHGTMIAAKQAEITVHLVGTIRNKLLDAFHELWRIGV
jgi:flagellar hook-basal body complex protein FliE